MKIQPAVREQTKAVAVGVCILTALMVGVFLVIGKFDWTVLTGALLGASAGIANFFLMALTVQKAADDMKPLPPEPEEGEADEDPKEGEAAAEASLSEGAKRGRDRVRLSYTFRMLGLGLVAVLGALLPCFNVYAVLIPLLFPGIVIRFLNR